MSASVFIWPGVLTNNGTTINPQLPIAFSDGTSAAPSLTLASQTGLGFYRSSANHLTVANDGATGGIPIDFAQGISLGANNGAIFGWSSTTSALGSSDTGIARLGAASIAIGNGSTGDFSGSLKLTTLTINNAAPLLTTSTALTDQAGVGGGTLTNAPSAGNPTKWIAINDNGTTRKIPTWT